MLKNLFRRKPAERGAPVTSEELARAHSRSGAATGNVRILGAAHSEVLTERDAAKTALHYQHMALQARYDALQSDYGTALVEIGELTEQVSALRSSLPVRGERGRWAKAA